MTPRYPDAQETIAKSMVEKDLQTSVEQRLRECGWTYYHTRDSHDSVEGFPDVVATRDGVTIMAELKTHVGKLTAAQLGWLDNWVRASHRIAVAERAVIGDSSSVVTPLPWLGESSLLAHPPMHLRLLQVYVWRPLDLMQGRVDEVLQ